MLAVLNDMRGEFGPAHVPAEGSGGGKPMSDSMSWMRRCFCFGHTAGETTATDILKGANKKYRNSKDRMGLLLFALVPLGKLQSQ